MVHAQTKVEPLSQKERAVVTKGLARIGPNRPLLFVFSPLPIELFCQQAEALSAKTPELHRLGVRVVWLIAYDAMGISDQTKTCDFPSTINDVSVRQMLVEEADSNDGGGSLLYRYFHVDSNKFTVLLLGRTGRVKFRSTQPVTYESIRRQIGP